MSSSERIEARIEAAFNDKKLNPVPRGDETGEADIPSSGLDIEEVRDHQLVKDVFENEDGSFHIYVSAKPPEMHFTSV